MIERALPLALLTFAPLAECGGGENGLSFEYEVMHGYPRDATMLSPRNLLVGVVTVTNVSSSTIAWDVPISPGYEAVDGSGKIVNRMASTTAAPHYAGGVWCLTGGSDICDQRITLAPGESKHLWLDDAGSGPFAWKFDAPNDPNTMGDWPAAPSSPVPPGVYHVAILLPNGLRTNPATVTICAGTSGAFPARFAVCNAPCASTSVAAQYQEVVDCGQTLTCP